MYTDLVIRRFTSTQRKTVVKKVQIYDVRDVKGGTLFGACSGNKFWKVE